MYLCFLAISCLKSVTFGETVYH